MGFSDLVSYNNSEGGRVSSFRTSIFNKYESGNCKEVRTYGLENLTVIHCLSLLYSAYYACMCISFSFLDDDVMMQQR